MILPPAIGLAARVPALRPETTMKRALLSVFLLAGLFHTKVSAQSADMQAIAKALGVECNYCHTERSGRPADPGEKTKKQIALEMIAMTQELNARVQGAAGKPANATVAVQCVTCHRGVAIPKQLPDIIIGTVRENGGAAAAEQYRTLRLQYYGRQSYDFSENELLDTIQRILQSRPDDAIILLKMNLEFNPTSARTYMALGYAYTRKFDDASAIANLEKALELEPNNGIARGQLEQIRSYQRRK
jgi:Flp pilus assembly protein TadD